MMGPRTLGATMLVAVLMSGCSRPGEEAHLQAVLASSEGGDVQQVINAAGPPSRTNAPDEECRAKNGSRELLYEVDAGWLNPSPERILALCVDRSGTIVNRTFSDIHGPLPAWSYLVYLLMLFLTVWQGARCPAWQALLLALGLFAADLAIAMAVEFVPSLALPQWLSVVLFLTVITSVRLSIVAAVILRLTWRLVASMAIAGVLTLGFDLLV